MGSIADVASVAPTGAAAGIPTQVLAGAIQAAATVIAVMVGYLLSTLAERKSWERRKSEQIRDRQLSALVELVACLQNAQLMYGSLERMRSGLEHIHVVSGTPITKARLRVDSIEARTAHIHSDLYGLRPLLSKQLLTLKLLGYAKPYIDIAERCVSTILDNTTSIDERSGGTPVDLSPVVLDALTADIALLIGDGEHGLRR